MKKEVKAPAVEPATLIGQVSQIKLMADGSWRLYVDCQPEDIAQGIERWAHEMVAVVVVDRKVIKKQPKIVKCKE